MSDTTTEAVAVLLLRMESFQGRLDRLEVQMRDWQEGQDRIEAMLGHLAVVLGWPASPPVSAQEVP